MYICIYVYVMVKVHQMVISLFGQFSLHHNFFVKCESIDWLKMFFQFYITVYTKTAHSYANNASE